MPLCAEHLFIAALGHFTFEALTALAEAINHSVADAQVMYPWYAGDKGK